MQSIHFNNRTIVMSGSMYSPHDFDQQQHYSAIVLVHPAGGVKEQTTHHYATMLAESGLIALTFDASYQGESSGDPRFLDDPMNRVNDISSAIDYLMTLPFIDVDRIGVFGICAGGGYAIKAASLDRRIKAAAVASAVNVGNATRKGWNGHGQVADLQGLLDTISVQRNIEAKGGEVAYSPYVPELGVTGVSQDLQDGAEYYLTERGKHPNASNKMLLTSLSTWVAFDAFNLVSLVLTQPICIVAGSQADSLWHSEELYYNALGSKAFYIIDGAGHMDLYDKRSREVAEKIIPFFQTTL